jgi:hypothetical protein
LTRGKISSSTRAKVSSSLVPFRIELRVTGRHGQCGIAIVTDSLN